MIIINGVNYHGHEIEAAVEELDAVSVSFTAACAVREDHAETDQLAIFFHTELDALRERAELLRAIQDQVVARVGVTPHFLLPLSKHAIPKTAIGKIQRARLVKDFGQGLFAETLRAVDLMLENERTLPNWFYEPVWMRWDEPRRTGSPRTALIFGDERGLSDFVGDALCQRGWTLVQVDAAPGELQILGDRRFRIDPARPEQVDRVFRALAELEIEVILHLWAYDPIETEDIERAQLKGIFSLLDLARRLVGKSRELLVASTGVQNVVPGDEPVAANATLPGFVKSLAVEFPGARVRLVDLGGDDPAHDGAALLDELDTISRMDEIAWRDGRRHVRRLKQIDFQRAARADLPVKRGGRYLVSGGLGGIGRHLARFLSRTYQARLLILGRRELTSSGELTDAAAELPPDAVYRAVDIRDAASLRRTVADAGFAAPDGVFHLASAYDERPLADEDREHLWSVMSAKTLGAVNLAALLAESGLFVAFSSIIGFFGGRDVAAYAAANSFLGGFAEHLRGRGLRAFCFDWGPWREIGMSRGYHLDDLFRDRGYASLSAKQGLTCLRACLQLASKPRLMIGLDETRPFVGGYVAAPVRPLHELVAFYAGADQDIVSDRIKTIRLEALPREADGAVDLETLRLMETGAAGSRGEHVPPRTEAERRITAIWRDLLPVAELGVTDNFFQLGGHSLLATQIVSRMQETFSIALNVRDLFRRPTIAELAKLLETRNPVAAEAPIQAGPRPELVPLSFAQQRLWFLSRLEGNSAYNIPFVLRILGVLDAALFERAMSTIVDRHESLRTRIVEIDGVAAQIVAPDIGFQVRRIDLRAITGARLAETIDSHSRSEAFHEFDLETGPLLRCVLLWVADREHILLLTLHHIISDGWSTGVLVKELSALYTAYHAGQTNPLPPLPIQYADFAVWQRERGETVFRDQLDWWRHKLDGLSQQLELPTDRRCPARPSYRAGHRDRSPLCPDREALKPVRAGSGRQPVHGFADRAPDPVRPLFGSEKFRRGFADRQSGSARVRTLDRVLYQYARPARRT